jgi:hypothetical protein
MLQLAILRVSLVRKAALEGYGFLVEELRFNSNYGVPKGLVKPCRNDSLYQRVLNGIPDLAKLQGSSYPPFIRVLSVEG